MTYSSKQPASIKDSTPSQVKRTLETPARVLEGSGQGTASEATVRPLGPQTFLFEGSHTDSPGPCAGHHVTTISSVRKPLEEGSSMVFGSTEPVSSR